MNASALDKQKLSVKLKSDEASRLLEGLEAMRDELGPLAEELIALLRDSGVTLPSIHSFPVARGGVKH